jgi:hypothetical protein
MEKFQTDRHWNDCVLFYQYFQTGWTGIAAKLIELFGRSDGEQFLPGGKKAVFAKQEPFRYIDARLA